MLFLLHPTLSRFEWSLRKSFIYVQYTICQASGFKKGTSDSKFSIWESSYFSSQLPLRITRSFDNERLFGKSHICNPQRTWHRFLWFSFVSGATKSFERLKDVWLYCSHIAKIHLQCLSCLSKKASRQPKTFSELSRQHRGFIILSLWLNSGPPSVFVCSFTSSDSCHLKSLLLLFALWFGDKYLIKYAAGRSAVRATDPQEQGWEICLKVGKFSKVKGGGRKQRKAMSSFN